MADRRQTRLANGFSCRPQWAHSGTQVVCSVLGRYDLYRHRLDPPLRYVVQRADLVTGLLVVPIDFAVCNTIAIVMFAPTLHDTSDFRCHHRACPGDPERHALALVALDCPIKSGNDHTCRVVMFVPLSRSAEFALQICC